MSAGLAAYTIVQRGVQSRRPLRRAVGRSRRSLRVRKRLDGMDPRRFLATTVATERGPGFGFPVDHFPARRTAVGNHLSPGAHGRDSSPATAAPWSDLAMDLYVAARRRLSLPEWRSWESCRRFLKISRPETRWAPTQNRTRRFLIAQSIALRPCSPPQALLRQSGFRPGGTLRLQRVRPRCRRRTIGGWGCCRLEVGGWGT